VYVGRAGGKVGAGDPAQLAVGIDSVTDETGLGAHDEVALEPAIEEMEFVTSEPHVGAAAANSILLRAWVIRGRSAPGGVADVGMGFKEPEGCLCGGG